MGEFTVILKLKGLYLPRSMKFEVNKVKYYLYPEYHSKWITQMRKVKKISDSGESFQESNFHFVRYKSDAFDNFIYVREDHDFFIITRMNVNYYKEIDDLKGEILKKLNPLLIGLQLLTWNFLHINSIYLFDTRNNIHTFIRYIEIKNPDRNIPQYWRNWISLNCLDVESNLPAMVQELDKKRNYFSYILLFIKAALEKDPLDRLMAFWRSIEQFTNHYWKTSSQPNRPSRKKERVKKFCEALHISISPAEDALIDKVYKIYNELKHEESDRDKIVEKYNLKSYIIPDKFHFLSDMEKTFIPMLERMVKIGLNLNDILESVNKRLLRRIREEDPIKYQNYHPKYTNILHFIERRNNWKKTLVLQSIPGELITDKGRYSCYLRLGWSMHYGCESITDFENRTFLRLESINEGQIYSKTEIDFTEIAKNMYMNQFCSKEIFFGHRLKIYVIIRSATSSSKKYKYMIMGSYNLDLMKT
ncbi:MAG: hypothetical protein ACFFCS_28345 [Candidatus Hodarchaeota archaeon]